MSNLAIVRPSSDQIDSFLSENERKIYWSTSEAKLNPRISDLDNKQLSEFAVLIWELARVKLGRDQKDDSTPFMAQLKKDFREKFGHLRVIEIQSAIDSGLDGDFRGEGETRVFFSPSNAVIWIRTWCEKVRTPVMTKVANQLQGAPAPEVIMIEADAKTRLNDHFNILHGALQRVCGGGTFIDGGNLIHDLLMISDTGFVCLSEIESQKIQCVSDRLSEIAAKGSQGCAEFMENVRQGILRHLNNQ